MRPTDSREALIFSPIVIWNQLVSYVMSKVIGFRELIDERFQSGDLFVAQFLLNIRTITASNADNIFAL